MVRIILKVGVAVLILALFCSALGLIWMRHHNRQLFIELQQLQQQQDNLNQEWTQLQLEQSTWAQQHRIETIAREQLQMISPEPQEISIIRP